MPPTWPDGGDVRGVVGCKMTTRTTSRQNSSPAPLTHEQIAALAEELWRERGCPEGSDIDTWLEAERQLRGGAPSGGERDPIPADPDRADADTDPALQSEVDREINDIGGTGDVRSPTAFNI